MTIKFIHVHASGRFDRSTSLLKQSLSSFKLLHATVITGTEADSAARRKAVREWADVNGWGKYTRKKGTPFSNDCYITWDKTVWNKIYVEHFEISTLDFFGGSKGTTIVPGQYATTAVLEHVSSKKRVLFSTTHTPSGVARDGGWRGGRTARRVVVWWSAQRGWKRRTNHLAKVYRCQAVVSSADFNVNLKRQFFKSVLKSIYPGRRLNWAGHIPTGGTHGKALIDGTLYKGDIRCTAARVIYSDNASDHKPYIETFSIV